MTRRPVRRRSLLVAVGGLSVVAWSVQALASGATATTPAKGATTAPAAISAPANSVTAARSYSTPTASITLGALPPRAGDPGTALYTGTIKASSGPRTVQYQLPNSQTDCVAIHAAHPELPAPPANCVTTVTLHILGSRSTPYKQSSGTQTNTGAAAAPAAPADPLPVPTPDMGGTTSVSGGPCVASANGGCVVSDPVDVSHDPSAIVPFVGPSNLSRPVDTNIASNPNAAARGLAVGAGGVYYANSMAGTNVSLKDNGQPNYSNEIQGDICESPWVAWRLA